jgi:co-chaperonin GroES (HSP10)
MDNTSSNAENIAGHGIRPIYDQVLVRQERPLERLHSGLYVPDTARRELYQDFGRVEGVGPKVLDVRVGDRVMFQRRADTALIPDAREGGREEWRDLLVLKEGDIIGIVEAD